MGKNRDRKLHREQILSRKRHRRSFRRSREYYTPNLEYEAFYRPIADTERTLLTAPSNFSLLENREEVLNYFHMVDDYVRKRVFSIFDMSRIHTTDMPTICLLISMMMDERLASLNFGRYISVRYPTGNHPAAKFFEKVEFEQTVRRDRGISNHNYFLSRTSTRDNKGYKGDILRQTQEFFGKNADLASLNPILTEIMVNTENHADPMKIKGEPNKIPWFAAVMPLEEQNKMCFCIVDLGIGIPENWNLKGVEQRKRGRMSKVIFDTFFQDTQGGILRKRIPEGVESSTRLIYRGQGLKEVYDQASTGPYPVFRLITNKAAVNLLDVSENIPDSNYNLGGTIFYWELQVG